MTDTTTATLSDFLTARLDEDEAVARAAQGRDESGERRTFYSHFGVGRDDWGVSYFNVDPARVLAECEAKRRIVELHVDNGFVVFGEPGFCMTCLDSDDPSESADYPCDTLRALAAIYADHAEFRPEWAL